MARRLQFRHKMPVMADGGVPGVELYMVMGLYGVVGDMISWALTKRGVRNCGDTMPQETSSLVVDMDEARFVLTDATELGGVSLEWLKTVMTCGRVKALSNSWMPQWDGWRLF